MNDLRKISTVVFTRLFLSENGRVVTIVAWYPISVVNVTQCLSVSKRNLQILLLNINASFLCIKNDFQLNRPVILRIFSSKWELIATVSKLSIYQSIWWIEYTVKSLQKSVQGKMSKLCHAIMRQNFALKLFKVKAFWKQIEKNMSISLEKILK